MKANTVFRECDVMQFGGLIDEVRGLRDELVREGMNPPWSATRGWEYAKLIRECQFRPPLIGKKVLDIGSATSVMPFYLARNGCEAYATDIILPDKKDLEWYKRQGIRYKKASIFNLPADDGFFDFVFSVCVLEHIAEFKNDDDIVRETVRALKEVARVLKPGGITGHTCDFYVKDFNTYRTYHKELLYGIISELRRILIPIDVPDYDIADPFEYYISNSTVYADPVMREEKHLKYLRKNETPGNLFTCASIILQKRTD